MKVLAVSLKCFFAWLFMLVCLVVYVPLAIVLGLFVWSRSEVHDFVKFAWKEDDDDDS